MNFESFSSGQDVGIKSEEKPAESAPEQKEQAIYKTLKELAKPDHWYRSIGSDGIEDIRKSGVIRANPNPQSVIHDGDVALKPKHQDAPFFISHEYIGTIEKYHPAYVIEYPGNTGITFARPSAGGHFGDAPWNENGEMISELSVRNASFYKKTEEGYEKINL